MCRLLSLSLKDPARSPRTSQYHIQILSQKVRSLLSLVAFSAFPLSLLGSLCWLSRNACDLLALVTRPPAPGPTPVARECDKTADDTCARHLSLNRIPTFAMLGTRTLGWFLVLSYQKHVMRLEPSSATPARHLQAFARLMPWAILCAWKLSHSAIAIVPFWEG